VQSIFAIAPGIMREIAQRRPEYVQMIVQLAQRSTANTFGTQPAASWNAAPTTPFAMPAVNNYGWQHGQQVGNMWSQPFASTQNIGSWSQPFAAQQYPTFAGQQHPAFAAQQYPTFASQQWNMQFPTMQAPIGSWTAPASAQFPGISGLELNAMLGTVGAGAAKTSKAKATR
jgi:hypothetical protein